MFSYNLLNESWIPTRNLSNEIICRGIEDTLKNAHQIKDISDPAPTIQYSLYRFLIAFIMDVYGFGNPTNDLEELEELIQFGQFDSDLIDAYIEKWSNRFDLFHEKYPFMQVPLPVGKKEKSISNLMVHMPTGNNVIHFHHLYEDENAYTPAVCARALITISNFAVGGLAGPGVPNFTSGINGSPPVYVLIRGMNLFETLVYNICRFSDFPLTGSEPPAWSSEKIPKPEEINVYSLLEGLTWRARAVTLIPEEKNSICTYSGEHSRILVSNMFMTPGFNARGDWFDPYVPYAYNKKGPYPIHLSENKDIWREIGPLMFLQKENYSGEDGKRYDRPLIVTQFKKLIDNDFIDQAVRLTLEVYGVLSDQAKILDWNYSLLSLPNDFVFYDQYGEVIQKSIDFSEKVSKQLQYSIKRAYPPRGKNSKEPATELISRAQKTFWQDCKLEFDNFLQIDRNDTVRFLEAVNLWKQITAEIGERVLNSVLDSLDSNAESIRRSVAARDYYKTQIYFMLNPEKSKKVKKGERNEQRI